MKRIEYMSVVFSGKPSEDQLNELGAEGWIAWARDIYPVPGRSNAPFSYEVHFYREVK